MMRVGIYSRKSVKSETGDSMENQEQLCRAYIAAHWPDAKIAVYEDEGFSGANIQRPKLLALLADIRQGKLDALVCYRLDRVSRSVTDFAALIEELNKHRVNFVCLREQFDTTTPMGKAMLYIASVFAQLERETIAERVQDNMQLLSRNGQWLGGPAPLGYCSEKITSRAGHGEKCRYVLRAVAEEGEMVRQAYNALLATESVGRAQRCLEKNGVFYTRTGVKSMLQNPVYCRADKQALAYFSQKGLRVYGTEKNTDGKRGLLAYNKRQPRQKTGARRPAAQWVLAVGCHEGLIEGEQWIRAQWLLNKNTRAERTPQNAYALFSGLIVCEKCDARLQAKRRETAEKFDYICRTKRQAGKNACQCLNLPGQETDDALEWAIFHEIDQRAAGEAKSVQQEMLCAFFALEISVKQQLYRQIIEKIVWDGQTLEVFFADERAAKAKGENALKKTLGSQR